MMYVCIYDNHSISMKGKQLIKIYMFHHSHLSTLHRPPAMVGSPLQMEGIDLGHVTEKGKKNC